MSNWNRFGLPKVSDEVTGEMPVEKRRYIGDSLYVEVVNGTLVLTTEDEGEVDQVIYLEPEEVSSLLQYIEDVADEL